MERAINYYYVDCDNDKWLQILSRFRSNLSHLRTIFFRDSERNQEMDFLRYCEAAGIRPIGKRLIESAGKPFGAEFYHWAVKDSGHYSQEFIEFACDGGGKGKCWRDAKQVEKIVVGPKLATKVEANGIVLNNFPMAPKIYIVTRSIRDAIQTAGFSGLQFTPCLDLNANYSVEERTFSTRVEDIEGKARYFQLGIIHKSPGSPYIGRVLAKSLCPRCGTATVVEGDREFLFNRRSLDKTDFQFFNSVDTDERSYEIMAQLPIISARALAFFVDQRIKGIVNYSSDPPVKFAAVQYSEE
jgi:hypothetical protein